MWAGVWSLTLFGTGSTTDLVGALLGTGRVREGLVGSGRGRWCLGEGVF